MSNFLSWNPKAKDIAIPVVCCFVGTILGGAMFSKDTVKKEIVEKPVEKIVEKPVEKIVTKEKEVCNKEAQWKELKQIDDEIINLSTQAIFIASDSFTAISKLDYQTVNANNKKIEALTPQMEIKAARRQQLIKELGY